MPAEEIKRVAMMYASTAEFYGRRLSDEVVRMYAHDLDDLPVAAVIACLRAMRQDPRRRTCPLPAEVRQQIRPVYEQNDPTMIASRIFGLVSSLGRTNCQQAKAEIGTLGWQAVEAMGGWIMLCSTLNADDRNTFIAQCRDLVGGIQDRAQSSGMRPRLSDRPRGQLPQKLVDTIRRIG